MNCWDISSGCFLVDKYKVFETGLDIRILAIIFLKSFIDNAQIYFIFAPRLGLVAQLNSALDYGSRGCGFESRRGHKKSQTIVWDFLIPYF
jgi:hypothetical protein